MGVMVVHSSALKICEPKYTDGSKRWWDQSTISTGAATKANNSKASARACALYMVSRLQDEFPTYVRDYFATSARLVHHEVHEHPDATKDGRSLKEPEQP